MARTAQVYRRAIDEAAAGCEFDMGMMDELETLSNRGNLRFTLDAMEKQTGTAIKVAPGSGHIVKIPRPEAAATGQDYGLLVRDITDFDGLHRLISNPDLHGSGAR